MTAHAADTDADAPAHAVATADRNCAHPADRRPPSHDTSPENTPEITPHAVDTTDDTAPHTVCDVARNAVRTTPAAFTAAMNRRPRICPTVRPISETDVMIVLNAVPKIPLNAAPRITPAPFNTAPMRPRNPTCNRPMIPSNAPFTIWTRPSQAFPKSSVRIPARTFRAPPMMFTAPRTTRTRPSIMPNTTGPKIANSPRMMGEFTSA